MSRAEFLRRLASQLSSLANLEAAEAHDVQAFLEAPPAPAAPGPAPGFVALRPRSRSRSPPPEGAPGRPLLSHRDRTDLPVKSCPVAPPDCSVSSPRHSFLLFGLWPCGAQECNGRSTELRSVSAEGRRFSLHSVPCSEGRPEASSFRRRRSATAQEGQASATRAAAHQAIDVRSSSSISAPPDVFLLC